MIILVPRAAEFLLGALAAFLLKVRDGDKIYAVITDKKKPLRVPMDRARAITLIKRLAPQSVIDRLIAKLMRSASSLEVSSS